MGYAVVPGGFEPWTAVQPIRPSDTTTDMTSVPACDYPPMILGPIKGAGLWVPYHGMELISTV